MDKRARRRDCFARIKALTAAEKAAHSKAIITSLSRDVTFENAETIFAYIALSGEPDLEELFDESPQKKWAFSRVNQGGHLQFHYVTSRDQLRRGDFGIYEPDPDICPAAKPENTNLIVIPGVSFDPVTGARLGRGKGHYDRYLDQFTQLPPLVGICFSTQLSSLEPETHDVPMDVLVTEVERHSGWHNSASSTD